MTTNRFIQRVLENLNRSSADIIASALISTDGLPIADALQSDADLDRVCGMSAALQDLGSRATKELSCGKLNQIMVKGDDGYILLVRAGEETVLMLTAREDAKLGMILLQARHAVKELAEYDLSKSF